MKSCPHCEFQIRVNELPHPGLFKDYRACPNCRGRFTVDISTKRLQFVSIWIALVSLALTVLLYFGSKLWIFPAAASYFVLGSIIYIGNRRLRFVPHEGPD